MNKRKDTVRNLLGLPGFKECKIEEDVERAICECKSLDEVECMFDEIERRRDEEIVKILEGTESPERVRQVLILERQDNSPDNMAGKSSYDSREIERTINEQISQFDRNSADKWFSFILLKAAEMVLSYTCKDIEITAALNIYRAEILENAQVLLVEEDIKGSTRMLIKIRLDRAIMRGRRNRKSESQGMKEALYYDEGSGSWCNGPPTLVEAIFDKDMLKELTKPKIDKERGTKRDRSESESRIRAKNYRADAQS